MKSDGFTLIELLLVMVVISILIVSSLTYVERKAESMRVDKAVAMYQQVLNAGLAYYIANGRWPNNGGLSCATCSELQPNFIPAATFNNPWGGSIDHKTYATTSYGVPPNTFVVETYFGTTDKMNAIGKMIAARLPNAWIWTDGYLEAYVNIPGENLNNANAINFAGVYHHGACVPVPTCPTQTAGGGAAMTPQVFLVPISVSGVNDSGNTNVYPISSFSAYATGGTNNTPALCTNQTTVTPSSTCTGGDANNMYWRACLQVITERGNVAVTRTDNWGQYVSMGAFTRCSISGEASGSGFTVYGN